MPKPETSKAPWSVVTDPDLDGPNIYIENEEGVIADVVSDNPADAHLIAAAPHLFETLDSLLFHFTPEIRGVSETIYAMAVLALRKARGKQL